MFQIKNDVKNKKLHDKDFKTRRLVKFALMYFWFDYMIKAAAYVHLFFCVDCKLLPHYLL
jgi:hypothetical protein